MWKRNSFAYLQHFSIAFSLYSIVPLLYCCNCSSLVIHDGASMPITIKPQHKMACLVQPQIKCQVAEGYCGSSDAFLYSLLSEKGIAWRIGYIFKVTVRHGCFES